MMHNISQPERGVRRFLVAGLLSVIVLAFCWGVAGGSNAIIGQSTVAAPSSGAELASAIGTPLTLVSSHRDDALGYIGAVFLESAGAVCLAFLVTPSIRRSSKRDRWDELRTDCPAEVEKMGGRFIPLAAGPGIVHQVFALGKSRERRRHTELRPIM